MALENQTFDDKPMDAGKDDAHPDDPPPFLRTWPRVYRAVLVYLFLLILGLYLVTRAFALRPSI